MIPFLLKFKAVFVSVFVCISKIFLKFHFFSSSEDGVAPPLADSDGGYAKAPAPEQMYGAAPFTESAKF